MLWIKALHIIFIITWFAGIFYLPRLFVYHAECHDEIGNARFKIMERRLYRGIMMPSGILATVFGLILLSPSFQAYMKQGWLHGKLALVVFLWIYHLYCGYLIKVFSRDTNKKSATFYRWFNEIPVVMLVGIVILVVVKPF